MVCKAVVSGIPATIWAMRRAANPTGGCNKTLPTQTSSMAAPSTPVRCNVSARTVSNNVAGGTWARPPLRARQRGVRVAQTITTSASSRVLVVGDGMVSHASSSSSRLFVTFHPKVEDNSFYPVRRAENRFGSAAQKVVLDILVFIEEYHSSFFICAGRLFCLHVLCLCLAVFTIEYHCSASFATWQPLP
eukprot:scaffold34916_cov170-Amphora_coffeaeformis.AAC.9